MLRAVDINQPSGSGLASQRGPTGSGSGAGGGSDSSQFNIRAVVGEPNSNIIIFEQHQPDVDARALQQTFQEPARMELALSDSEVENIEVEVDFGQDFNDELTNTAAHPLLPIPAEVLQDARIDPPQHPPNAQNPDPHLPRRGRPRARAPAPAEAAQLNAIRLQFYRDENERQHQLWEMRMLESRQACLRHRIRAEADAEEGLYWRQRNLDESAARRRGDQGLPATLPLGPPLAMRPLTADERRLIGEPAPVFRKLSLFYYYVEISFFIC